MTKRLMMTLCLLLCAALLCSCAPVEQQQSQGAGQQNPLDNWQNAGIPEVDDYIEVPQPVQGFQSMLPVISSQYAGATPVVIDPIDKPTATPVPPLSFSYQVYDATKLHLSFEGPSGWTVSDTEDNVFVITNPDTSMDFGASLTIRTAPTATVYGETELKNEVNAMLNSLNAYFAKFSPSRVDSRKVQDWTGMYANYTAVMSDGVKVAGRVHAWSHEKTVYVLLLAYPEAYTRTYIDNVYDKFIHSLKVSR